MKQFHHHKEVSYAKPESQEKSQNFEPCPKPFCLSEQETQRQIPYFTGLLLDLLEAHMLFHISAVQYSTG